MRKLILSMVAVLLAFAANAKTLIVYYSYTNNVEHIVAELCSQIDADVLEIEPAEKGLDYAANGYAIGSAQIAAIRNNPNEASSYPLIDPVNVNLADYDCIIIGAPLWWSQMAAPLQTYLFHHGAQMAGKKIGLVISSASSGISGVEADAHRLIPEGNFLTPSLWVRSSQMSNCRSMVSNWLEQIGYGMIASGVESTVPGMMVSVSVAPSVIHVEGKFDSFVLYSLSGHKVLESSKNKISTSSLLPGAYVAQINVNAQSVLKKIIVIK